VDEARSRREKKDHKKRRESIDDVERIVTADRAEKQQIVLQRGLSLFQPFASQLP
jgi:hypothetical protein